MPLRNVIRTLGIVIGIALALAGPAAAQEGGSPGDPDNGAALYAANCLVCHGPSGEGRAGASLSEVYGGINPDAFLADAISRGRPGTFMAAWSQAYGGPLTDSEVQDLVAYIESWGTTVEPVLPAPRRPAQTIPPVAEVDGDPNEGYVIFQTNCVACHGEDATGRAGATLTTAFAAISPGAFAIETISQGVTGTLMPAFGQAYGGPLSEEDINNVAAYVLSIQRQSPPRPGEQVGQGSAWPLVIVLAATAIVIVALGIAVQRRERRSG